MFEIKTNLMKKALITMIKVKVSTNKNLSPRAIENLNKVFTEIFNKDSTRFLKPQKKGA